MTLLKCCNRCVSHCCHSWLLHHLLGLQDKLPESFNLDPKYFDHVLNVVKIDGRFHWNVHAADSSYRQTVLLTQPSQREVSSAVHKLQEALAVLGHKLDSEQAAIDLGGTAAGSCMCLCCRVAYDHAPSPPSLSQIPLPLAVAG